VGGQEISKNFLFLLEQVESTNPEEIERGALTRASSLGGDTSFMAKTPWRFGLENRQ